MSRAYAIILREVYGYKNIYLYEFDFQMSEEEKTLHTYEAYKLDMSREYLKRFERQFAYECLVNIIGHRF